MFAYVWKSQFPILENQTTRVFVCYRFHLFLSNHLVH